MLKTVRKPELLRIKAFTLLESLLVLFVTSLILLGISGSVQTSFEELEEQLFFLEFEHLYQESQKLSVAGQQKVTLTLADDSLSNGYRKIDLPKTVKLQQPQTIQFDQAGGNSSLSKIAFQTQERTVTYQLYIGNGKFKRKTD